MKLSADTQEQVPKRAIKSDEPTTALFFQKDTDTCANTTVIIDIFPYLQITDRSSIHLPTDQVVVRDPHRVQNTEGYVSTDQM